MNNLDYDIFSGSKFVESIRSSGYKDTSYAVAELVDNSIDARSKHVYIISQEKTNPSTGRYFLDKIAVLDDGTGMNAEELRRSLLFGDGTRGEEHDIGKFGMGLPNASLSQCKRVEVYSWQNSNIPMYCYLDYDEVRGGNRKIPIPNPKDMPNILQDATINFSKKSGTLVIWSKLDRCSWSTSNALMRHSQFIIGRIYRRFLHRKKLEIEMVTLKLDSENRIIECKSKDMLPNDPMYLMSPSSTPGQWGAEPMFKPDTKPEDEFTIKFDGKQHIITARYSLEKDELRDPARVQGDQGNVPHGKHAKKNMGVSIMRADREISMDTNLLTDTDSRERWWGVEIDVPTSLDNVVGITNNKQRMDVLSTIMYNVGRFVEDGSDEREMEEDLAERYKTGLELLRMVKTIKSHISSMSRRIRMTRKGTRGGPDQKPSAEIKFESGLSVELGAGKKSQTDKDRETMEKKERIVHIVNALEEEGYEEDTANATAEQWINEDRKIVFIESELDGSNFFSVSNMGGILQVKINRNHRAYKNLLSLTNAEEYKEMRGEEKLVIIHDGLRLLLASWARFEDLISNDERRRLVQDTRYDWGKELDLFLEKNMN